MGYNRHGEVTLQGFRLRKVKVKSQFSFPLGSESLLQLWQDTAGCLEMYRPFMDLPGGLSMSRGSSERERGWGHLGRKNDTVK